jgi:hypothetical protein
LVAIATRERKPLSAKALPTISSERPNPWAGAVSIRSTPWSIAARIVAIACDSLVPPYACGEGHGEDGPHGGLPAWFTRHRRAVFRSRSLSDPIWRAPVPGQQIADPLGGIIGQARQHVVEPGLRIDIVELGGLCRLPNYAERARFPQDSS